MYFKLKVFEDTKIKIKIMFVVVVVVVAFVVCFVC